MSPARDKTGTSPAPPERAESPRLPVLRELLSHRHAANERLRRSLWLSFLFHLVLFVGLVPLSMPSLDEPVETPRVVEVHRIVLPSLVPEGSLAPLPEPERAEPEPELAQPEPELDAERIEFVRPHLGSSDEAPDTDRVSTHDQRVAVERHTRARSQVADGTAHLGTQAGSPQKAARAGALPQQPSSRRNADASKQARATREAANTAGRHSDKGGKPIDDPCSGEQVDAAPCRALAQASSNHATTVALREREGWDPIPTRLTGVQPDARPFEQAPQPTIATPTLEGATHDLLRSSRAKSSLQTADKESLNKPSRRSDTARADQDRASKPHSGSADNQAASPKALPDRQPTPDPELRFLVDPVQVAREERERQARESQKEDRNRHRRPVPLGTSSPSVASVAGSEAAAGGSLVSPLDPPPILDIKAALSTRHHPLASMLQSLDNQLRESWEIPFDIRVSGIVGTTGLEFLIDDRGRVSDVQVVRPSGHPQLDAVARASVPAKLAEFQVLRRDEGTRDAFPEQGLRVEYQFSYKDSPVAGIL